MLVVCPNSLKKTWANELQRFAPDLTWKIIEGAARQRQSQLGNTEADIVIINYEATRSELLGLRAMLKRRPWVLVLDESHSVKNIRSLTSLAARHLAPLVGHRWLLSGTPVTNRVADIYTQVHLVADGEPLGSYDGFLAWYPDSDPGRLSELTQRITPYVLRRRKEDCLDLPEKTFVDVFVRLPPWQRSLYDGVRDGILADIRAMSDDEFKAFAPTALTRVLRMAQVASNPSLVFPEELRTPAKVKELDGLIDELVAVNERKVIIWSPSVTTIEALRDRYAEHGSAAIYGGVATSERQVTVDRFQNDPCLKILVANPAAAGMGFTMTGAHFAIYESLGWRYDHYAQSQDRIHRIGQELPVTYLRLIAEDTIDELITAALERKATLAGGILGDDTGALFSATGMTREQFCNMLESNLLPTAPK